MITLVTAARDELASFLQGKACFSRVAYLEHSNVATAIVAVAVTDSVKLTLLLIVLLTL